MLHIFNLSNLYKQLVWNDLKLYLCTECKPSAVKGLIAEIKLCWRTVVTIEYCNSKINHDLNKVIQHVIRVHGKATGLIRAKLS